MPEDVRRSIFTALTARLGLGGEALAEARKAFATSQDVRRATGVLGLVFTFFYANSFTTALQRVYLRAWRRPRGGGAANYVRGPAWLAAVLVYFALLGGLRELLDGPVGTAVFVVVTVIGAIVVWWLTAWLMLRGQVRRPRAVGHGRDHRHRDGDVREHGVAVDAERRDQPPTAVRLLRRRARARHVVQRQRVLHRRRCVRRFGPRAGHGSRRAVAPWRGALGARPGRGPRGSPGPPAARGSWTPSG